VACPSLSSGITKYQEEQVAQSVSEFELDESYFDGIKKKTHY